MSAQPNDQAAAERKARHEAWLRLSSPSAAHKAIEPIAGTFSAKTTAWFMPGQPPAESDGSSNNSLILGGRYLQQQYKSTGPFGVFEGFGLFGHDNQKQKYTGLWTDTMSTAMMQHEGTYDAMARTFTMLGSFVDPVGATWHTRQIIRVISNDQHSFEMFQKGPSGPEYKSLEAVYKRVTA
jgi:hypothetical protein